MKLLILLFGLILTPTLALTYSKDLTTTIDSITVFTEDAQLNRSKYIELKQGENTFRFINLELDINSNSIQLFGSKGNKNISIISTRFSKEVTPRLGIEKTSARMNDSIQNIEQEIKLINHRIKNLTHEKALILAHAKIEYKIEIDYINLLNSLTKYYRESTYEIDKLILNLESKKVKKTALKSEIDARLIENNKRQFTGVIEAKIYASRPTKHKLKLSYILSGVSWTPFYDIKSNGIKHPLSVSCKATVRQNTGIDWTNVSLTLSTRKPITLSAIPTIHPWVLHFKKSYKKYSDNNLIIDQMAISNSSLPISAPTNINNNHPLSSTNSYFKTFNTATHKMINKDYRNTIKYNISGKNGVAVVELDRFKMETKYKYYSIPKYDKNVYLVAEVDAYEQYDLIPAFANIFLEGIYIGKLFINPEVLKSSLELMLGKDADIIVDRRKITQSLEKQRKIIGNTHTSTIEIELSIKNRKKTAIDLIIKDQVPVSSHADILVDVLKTSKAALDSTSGTLTWQKHMLPQKSNKYIIKYEVVRPKNKKIVNF